ncbi:hypothetical protein PVAND_004250 [Polypedilum vanderplanki]|uniref:Reverse transcriptase domain-containing protein n=1 Tax=Polypedilum vanderplanki TaxID=319348 RepID=A0A9J6BYJ3_POLVA|nr:hypothetical protein PVAND_004250 [Polypedilum vanderplanki]
MDLERNATLKLAALELINDEITIRHKEKSCTHYVGLKKAFDVVDHLLLTESLERYGIRGSILDLFANYLSDRRQISETKLASAAGALWKLKNRLPLHIKKNYLPITCGEQLILYVDNLGTASDAVLKPIQILQK